MIEKKFMSILDNMMEGFQIIDYDWRYIYVNDAAAKQGHTTKEELLGKTMMEVYPGIEKTELFSHLKRCMNERVPAQIENKFTYSNGKKDWFKLSIQAVPEGILILSMNITDRKLIEEKLTQSEDWYRTVFETTGTAMSVVNEDGTYSQVNREFEKLVGYSQEELWKKKWTAFVSKNDLDRLMKTHKAIWEKGAPLPKNFEFELVTKEGKRRRVFITAKEFPNAKKSVGSVIDITEYKKAEEEIWSLAKFPSENPDPIFRITKDGTILYANKAAEAIKWKMKQKKKLLPEKLQQSIVSSLNSGLVEEVEIEYADRVFSFVVAPLTEEGYVNSYGRDITEHRKAEEHLKEEKEKFETYLNLARVIMLAIDVKGVVTYINKQGCEVLGYKKEEIVDKDWLSNFLPERTVKKTERYLQNLFAGQTKPVEYNENSVLTKSGEERIIAWHNIRLRDKNGAIVGTLSSGKDITELKKTKDEMRKLSYKLNGISPGECYISESEKKFMNIFAYSVAHGRPGLCITRKNPETLTEKCSLKPEHIRLLSSTPIKGFQVLSNLQEVSLEIAKFLKNGGGIVLLEGLEYLVSRFGFNPVYNMLQEKRFSFLDAKAVLLIPINFEAVTNQEKALLASEFKTIT